MDKEVFAYGSDTPPLEAESDHPQGGVGAEPKRWVQPLLIGALVLALALAGTFAALWAQSRETSSEDVSAFLAEEAPAVETRAREVVELLMNYDATNLDERTEQIRAISTGTFLQQYEELIDQGLGAVLEEASASSRGQIISGPDVYFRSPSESVALVRVNQTTQSSDNPTGGSFLYMLRVTMVKTAGDEWVIQDVKILSEEAS